MASHSLQFGGVTVDAPPTWREITDELDFPNPPFTFADASKDVGALQFSVAFYESGSIPDPSPDDLLNMALELGEGLDFAGAHDQSVEDERLRLGAVSYRAGDSFIRIWYLSDGKNLAKATYTCTWGRQAEQVEECEKIVRSMRFGELG